MTVQRQEDLPGRELRRKLMRDVYRERRLADSGHHPPGGRAFSQDNTVSITGSLRNSGDGYDSACLGLEEDGSAGGYLAAYCNTGDWYIYTTSAR